MGHQKITLAKLSKRVRLMDRRHLPPIPVEDFAIRAEVNPSTLYSVLKNDDPAIEPLVNAIRSHVLIGKAS